MQQVMIRRTLKLCPLPGYVVPMNPNQNEKKQLYLLQRESDSRTTWLEENRKRNEAVSPVQSLQNRETDTKVIIRSIIE